MTSELLIKQLETYSNAIVTFSVLQGIAYCFAFGTSAFFNCLVKTSLHLAEGLTLIFALAMLFSVVATVFLGRVLRQLSGEFRSTVERVYFGKLLVVIVFNLLPLAVTVAYGVRDYPTKVECRATLASD
jgi:uncharacterized membrane protein YedE/YeeE